VSERSAMKGSWDWALRVSERTALTTVAALFVVIHADELEAGTYRLALALAAGLLAVIGLLFRVVLPHLRYRRLGAWLGVAVGTLSSVAIYALLKGEVPSAHLFFIPPLVMAGMLGDLMVAGVASLLAVGGYLGVGQLTNQAPGAIPALLNSSIFLFSGLVSGLLSQELREHFRREMVEHRLATAVGHRLTAVLGSIEEAIVFSNRAGVTKMVNRRAAELFDIDPNDYQDAPVVQLLRVVARETEDPEGFMETFQQLRDEPERELGWDVEQIIPSRRVLRVLARPVKSSTGALVGRIDVYTDITEGVRRAAAMEEALAQARKTAESYVRGLLPQSIPSLPRVGVVAHYVPATSGRGVSGDFYDFMTFKDGRVGLLIGDVVGIGPEAVSDASMTRYTLRSLSRTESEPGALMELVNDALRQDLGQDRFVRAVFAVLDPERAVLEYCNAGHAPPILFRAKRGNIDRLEEGGLPLGVDVGERYKTARLELDPGDSVLFYTDGVTEATRLGKPMGQGRLSDLVRQYGFGTPGELVQGIRRAVEAWVDDELRDDMAMIGCQVVPDTSTDIAARELVLPNDPARLRDVRDFVAEFMSDLRVSVEITGEMLLAVSEAAGNAAKYGRSQQRNSEVRVRCSLEGTDITITVSDEGPGFEIPSDSDDLPDPLASGGRGLFLMKHMTDHLSIATGEEGTVVTLQRKVFEQPPTIVPAIVPAPSERD
jgi:serine phosphatase RsbU (regulator of sigma subunit)/anti-sigma regulatory factor (Ser/Thr protein kinase)/PAS domain-containing protein